MYGWYAVRRQHVYLKLVGLCRAYGWFMVWCQRGCPETGSLSVGSSCISCMQYEVSASTLSLVRFLLVAMFELCAV